MVSFKSNCYKKKKADSIAKGYPMDTEHLQIFFQWIFRVQLNIKRRYSLGKVAVGVNSISFNRDRFAHFVFSYFLSVSSNCISAGADGRKVHLQLPGRSISSIFHHTALCCTLLSLDQLPFIAALLSFHGNCTLILFASVSINIQMPSSGDVSLYKVTPMTFQPLLNGNLPDSGTFFSIRSFFPLLSKFGPGL